MRLMKCLMAALTLALLLQTRAHAQDFFFSSGDPDGLMAVATRPESPGKIEHEAGSNFVLQRETLLINATFVGIIPPDAQLSDISQVTIEIYRVFPNDSDPNRPIQVPTRVNSPADVEFDDRSSADGSLSYVVFPLDPNFPVQNTVITGIFPSPDQTTGGDGPTTGQGVLIDVTFVVPFDLPADNYFFVPQVQLDNPGDFLWLSSPFPAFDGNLQLWTRDANLDPDWLRVATDIVGGDPKFNGSFTITGLEFSEEENVTRVDRADTNRLTDSRHPMGTPAWP